MMHESVNPIFRDFGVRGRTKSWKDSISEDAPVSHYAVNDRGIPYLDDSSASFTMSFQPGNGTRYDLLFVALEDARQCVVLRNFNSCFETGVGGFVHPSYLMEKLRIPLADSVALAELLSEMYQIPEPTES